MLSTDQIAAQLDEHRLEVLEEIAKLEAARAALAGEPQRPAWLKPGKTERNQAA